MTKELPHVGEIWMTQFDLPFPHEPAALRPALIIAPSTDIDHIHISSIVIPFTSKIRKYEYWHPINPSIENGLLTTSHAQCDQLRSINKTRMRKKLGIIEIDDWQTIRELVRQFLSL
jgi:mRNA interferase MazF